MEKELAETGRVWCRDALCDHDLAALDRVSENSNLPGKRLEWQDGFSAILGPASSMARLAQEILPGARPVRLVVFNKSPGQNWSVPWHQDRVISVKERHDLPDYGPWSRKNGTWHVEPPAAFLNDMIFARLHLDDTDENNGCLELALGSHRHGRVEGCAVDALAKAFPREICRAMRGDVLFVHALTLHRSKPSRNAAPRRTLRVDYCAKPLPKPLQWALQPCCGARSVRFRR